MAAYNEALKAMFAMEEDREAATKRAASDDDSKWPTMQLPGNWEGLGLDNLDGIVWYRKTITIPAGWAGKDLILRPGPIDEVDLSFFNGEWVGGEAPGLGLCDIDLARIGEVRRQLPSLANRRNIPISPTP
jgi:hypothetical protein